MGIGDIFHRTVYARVESIIPDLSTQRWSIGKFKALNDNRTRFQFEMYYRPNESAWRTSYGTLLLDERGIVIDLPWHFAPADYHAHTWKGLQLEGTVPMHDDFLRIVVASMVRRLDDKPREVAAALADPQQWVHGFESAVFPCRRLCDLKLIQTSEERRELAYTILCALADGRGKCGAVAHLQCRHDLTATGAYKMATSIMRTFPVLFCRCDGAKYHLSQWGHHILKGLTNERRGGDFSW